MKPTLKSLDEQVIVITGASSGIGLATAQAAAQAGAKPVLAARSEARLAGIVETIDNEGGEATLPRARRLAAPIRDLPSATRRALH